MEWRFRSNHPLGLIFFGCDGHFVVDYGGMHQLTNLYGDAAISASGGDFVAGLDIDEFHTYRYESLDGVNFTIAVDGQVFIDRFDNTPSTVDFLQFGGGGGCLGDEFPNMVNEWDHVWFGTISTGEEIIASDPPAGHLDPQIYAELDRFTVTFDGPNYVHLDDITVEVTGGIAPAVTQTRPVENGEPEVVEIVLADPLPMNALTRFTFDDGETVNVVAYTLGEVPAIPSASQWGVVVMTVLVLTAGTVILVRRFLQARWFF